MGLSSYYINIYKKYIHNHMLILEVCLFLAAVYLLIKYQIRKIRRRAPECYRGHPFFEFLSGFFDKYTNPRLNINESKVPNKPCLFLMNHVDISDPLFILQIIKLQKTPRKLIYVATTEYHKYPFVKKLLEEDECIFVELAELPAGVTPEQGKMTTTELDQTSLSFTQKQQIKEYQKRKQTYADNVINDMVERLKSGYNVFIFPTGTFDHYNHKPDMVRGIRPGAAKAIMKCIQEQVDIEILILKKLGVPKRYAGSFFWSLPYMLMGGSRQVRMSLEAAIPRDFFKHPLIQRSTDPIKIITALYASYMSTEDLQSPCNTQKLQIQALELSQEELEMVKQLREILKLEGYSEVAVKDPSRADSSKEFGYTLDITLNPFLALKKKIPGL